MVWLAILDPNILFKASFGLYVHPTNGFLEWDDKNL